MDTPYTYSQKCLMDLSDNYTLMYSFISRELLNTFGIDGERAVREATRRYGRDRGETSRDIHLSLGVKINMQSLFSVRPDLPPDPRFRREKQALNPEERVSHTLVCPMADIWKAYGEREIGRIYCEEFHPACYRHYAYDLSHVHLAKTLTQENDDYCAFNVVLRAQDVPDELKPNCFAEYDIEYQQPDIPDVAPDGKRGFETLSIKLYYYLLETAVEAFGESGAAAVENGLRKLANDCATRAMATALEYQLPVDSKLISDTIPFSLTSDMELWDKYQGNRALERLDTCFVPVIRELLSGEGSC